MKRIIISILSVIILITGIAVFLIKSEKILIRSPLLVQNDAKVTFIIGKGYYRENEEANWETALVGIKLKPGYEVKTARNSLMDIRFHSGMALRLPANTLLKLTTLSIKQMELNLLSGGIYGKFKKIHKEHSIQVKTPTIVASVRGTELGFEISQKRSNVKTLDEGSTERDTLPITTVYAVSGITEIYNPTFNDDKILLSYQKKITVPENSPAGDPETLGKKEVRKLRNILNSIHNEEVLLITNKILFKSGSSKILKRSYKELNRIVLMLKKKKAVIRIEGHTDNKGSAAENLTLSVKRAAAIRRYLVKKGITERTLLITGFGESKPIATNTSLRGKALNRRVEFIVVDQ